MLINFQES
jgi:hypothetical protein